MDRDSDPDPDPFEVTYLRHFSKVKSERSHKTVGIKVFLILFLLDYRRIGSRILGWIADPDPH
jgi:hypothetical protein